MLKVALLWLLFFSYLFSQAHIFVYHRFDDSRYKTTNININILKKQFDYLKKHNYKVVSLDDIIKKIKSKQNVPNNWVSFCIDDGYKSFYQNGYPVFKKYNYPFAIFVYIEATNKRYNDFMSWNELKNISKDKLATIALHSYSHPHLLNLSLNEVEKDTLKAKEIFKTNLGYYPKYYSYPYGEYNKNIKDIIKPHFEAIFNQNIGVVTKNSDIFDIDRIALTGNSDIKKKLKYTFFDVKWIKPNKYPKDDILKTIEVFTNTDKKFIKLFISGYGWRDVEVKDGMVKYRFNKKLIYKRNRIIIGESFYKISTKLLVKSSK